MAWHALVAGHCRGVKPLEIWASPEPTVARIDATTFRDQIAETGHDQRADDADRLVSLGVHATRVPILWERCAPERDRAPDFREPSRRIARLVRGGVEPIGGLLHHGSGPLYTDLLDPAFADAFEAFALAAARAHPTIERWTPINEPLTTGRFSTLYGVWFPNVRDDRAFGRAMVHQTRAIQQAMRAIRSVRADAKLVFTEDLQRFVAADAGVEAYGAFLRERSFLSIELVAGRVDTHHPLAAFLQTRCGVTTAELELMQREACEPALVAFNHYPHSERYLFSEADGRIGDVPLVYVEGAAPPHCGDLIRNAAARLQLPVGLGEVHIHANAAERVRWLANHAADLEAARADGVDVRALGVWAAFGMVDWHSLLRVRSRVVEDGIFTFAGPHGTPVETPVAAAVRALVRGETIDEGGVRGWWERADRSLSRETLVALRDAGIPEGEHVRIVDEAFA